MAGRRGSGPSLGWVQPAKLNRRRTSSERRDDVACCAGVGGLAGLCGQRHGSYTTWKGSRAREVMASLAWDALICIHSPHTVLRLDGRSLCVCSRH